MAQNGTYRGNFLGPKYFFHKPIYVTEKIRPCLKSLVIFWRSCDFFHSVAGSGYQYCGVWLILLSPGIFMLIILLNLSGPYFRILCLVSGVNLKIESSMSAQWSSNKSMQYLLTQEHLIAVCNP